MSSSPTSTRPHPRSVTVSRRPAPGTWLARRCLQPPLLLALCSTFALPCGRAALASSGGGDCPPAAAYNFGDQTFRPATAGSLVAVPSGRAGVDLLDLSDPAAPTALAHIDVAGDAGSVAISGTTLFVAHSTPGVATSVDIFDIVDPARPQPLATIDVGPPQAAGFAQRLAVAGSTLLLLVNPEGPFSLSHVIAIDVSAPARPTLGDAIDIVNFASDLAVGSTHAYVCNGGLGVTVVDFSDPADLAVTTTIAPIGGAAEHTAVDGSTGKLLVIENSDRFDMSTRRLFSLADPARPTTLATASGSGQSLGVAADQGRAVVVDAGLFGATASILDLAPAGDPDALGSFEVTHGVDQVVIGAQALILSSLTTGLHFWNIDNPEAAVLVSSADLLPSSPTTVAVADGLACMISGPSLFVVDVSESSAGSLVGSWRETAPTGLADGIARINGPALYVGSFAGTRIFDISDPSAPQGGPAIAGGGAALLGDRLYTVSGGVLRIWDVTDPLAPTSVGTLPVPGSPFGASASAAGTDRFAISVAPLLIGIYDATDRDAPVLLGSVPVPSSLSRCEFLDDSTLVIGQGFAGLRIVDIADPTQPIDLATVAINAGRVALRNQVAFAGANGAAVHAVDLSDPAAPRLLDTLSFFGPTGLAVDGDRLVIGTLSDGLSVHDVSTCPGGGSSVPGDLDGDGSVGGADLGLLLGSWGPCAGCPADLDGNGTVDGADLGALLGAWSA